MTTNRRSSQLSGLLTDAFKVSFDLFKIMAPVIVAVKILQELGWIGYLALPLGPVMKAVGLPQEMGLVWATAMLNNLYSAILVLATLVNDAPLTAAQATVLGTMMLVAHALPIELKIAQKSGARLTFQAITRMGAALLLGWTLHLVYSSFGLLQGPANVLFGAGAEGGPVRETLLEWSLSQARNLLFIFFIILGLLILMKALKRIRALDAMNALLRPLLKLIGIGPKASALTIIGLTMGISYGGGLIIYEAKSGNIDRKDVFYSLTLMGISHSLIEDTLLMTMIGAHLSGLLWGRLLFAFLLAALLVKVCARHSRRFADSFLWSEPK